MTQGSLFDGFGGIRRGLEQAGLVTKWARDIIYGHDIRTDDPGQLERVDLISGGPPCTKTSLAAAWHQQRDYTSLWPFMLRVIEALLPNWVLVEQPKGGRVIIEEAATSLQRLGYGCAGRIIDSRHWVPQTRSRWLLVARMGLEGMDLWNRLYPDGQRVEGQDVQEREGSRFDGNCPDCVRGGIYSGILARKPALVAAGNALPAPVSRWVGEQIVRVEERMRQQK